MNYPFIKTSTPLFRRLLCMALAVVMLCTLTGCFDLTKPTKSTEDTSSNLPNLVDIPTSDPTVDTEAPTEDTEAPTEEPETNIAVVKEQLNMRSSPSGEANIKAQLDAGERVEVLRIEKVNKVVWAYIRPESVNTPGWVTAALLDMTNVTAPTSGEEDTPAGQGQENTTTNPEETKPTTTVTGNGTKGVVIATDLNIRKEASSTSDRVGGLTYGDRVSISETSNGWGRIKDGWISMQYVYVDGQTGKNTCTGAVTATELRVRSGPGTTYDQVSTLKEGAKVEVLEQITIGKTTWGCIKGGWISMDYVSSNGSTGGTVSNNNTNTNTNTGSATAIGTATVTSNGLYIRSGAGTNYDTVGALKKGESTSIYEKVTVNGATWGKTSTGWICLDYCELG